MSDQKLMFGVHYRYYDQYSREDRSMGVVFSSRKKAQKWIDNHSQAPYLKIVTLRYNPNV